MKIRTIFARFFGLVGMKTRICIILLIVCCLTSCGEYYKLLKSDDYEAKWQKANEYYEQGKYGRTIELLEELKAIYKGTERAEQTLYMLANAYYRSKDYYSATNQYQIYYKTYPKGIFAEECRFMSGKSAFDDSPDPRLSQEGTVQAMDELSVFLEYYPNSQYRPQVEEMLDILMEKLAYKALLNCELYYNLGNYMGNNYESCIITANNALNDFPSSKYRVDFAFMILKSRYTYAQESVEAMQPERYRRMIDEYYSFNTEYPESKYQREAKRMFDHAQKALKDNNKENK